MDLNVLSVVLWYLAGHALVVILARVGRSYLRREPALEPRRAAVFELNSKPARIEAGQAELVTARGELQEVDRHIGEVRETIETYVRLEDPPSTVLAYFLLALILTEGEAAVLLLLSGPVHFLGFSLEVWAFAAVPAAAIWVTALHVLIGAMLTDTHRPARTVRRAKLGAIVSGAAVILGAWMILSGRNLTDADLVAELAGIGLMTLSMLLSLTAAFCSIIASTVYEAQSHERRLARLEQRRTAYVRHIELVEKDVMRLQPVGEVAPLTPEASMTAPTARAAAPAGLVPTVMLVALALLPALGVAQPVPVAPPPAALSCENSAIR